MLPDASLLESVAARPGYNLCLSTAAAILYSCSRLGSWLWKQAALIPAWSYCWGWYVYQAFRGCEQYILYIVDNVQQKARHNSLVQAALIALRELVRSSTGCELSPVLCNV